MDGSARPRAVARQLHRRLELRNGLRQLNDMGFGWHPRATEDQGRNVTGRQWTWEGRATDTSNTCARWGPVHVFEAADVSISQRINITTAAKGVGAVWVMVWVSHGQMSA